MTGRDVLETMLKMAEMGTGKSFTVYVDLDTVDVKRFRKENDQAGETIEPAIQEEGQKRIDELLHPAMEAWEQFREHALKSGLLFKDTERGWGIRCEQLLSLEEEGTCTLLEVREKLNDVNTFIKL